MITKKVLVCPKCNSSDISWHHGGRTEQRICNACGHTGIFGEKIVHDEGEDVWP